MLNMDMIGELSATRSVSAAILAARELSEIDEQENKLLESRSLHYATTKNFFFRSHQANFAKENSGAVLFLRVSMPTITRWAMKYPN